MDILQAIILGVVEGFTEFLPISSTGHMIMVSDFFGIEQDTIMKAYEVIIQFAAILAVMVLYREKITLKETKLWINVMIAATPLLVIGYIFRYEIKELFSIEIVAWMFIIGGVIFLLIERFYDENKKHIVDVSKIGVKESLYIGFAQLFSFIPGTSRAGATIIGGMLFGLDRRTSTEFSFLLAIPVMLAVSGYDLLKHYKDFQETNLAPYIIGFVVAFIVAYGTIKLFLEFLKRFTFVLFGWYRIVLGVILLAFWVY
ncbi:MAG TPA: undecaprenyl-diphosphate phosphatase [Epsilonproteobacteria bacterium]|nr:undecaprenyl-diphosphate phosphatase [Campylobacterota bacterium]